MDVGESCIRQSDPYTNSYEHMSCSWPLMCADSTRPDTFIYSWFESCTDEPSSAADLDDAPGLPAVDCLSRVLRSLDRIDFDVFSASALDDMPQEGTVGEGERSRLFRRFFSLSNQVY